MTIERWVSSEIGEATRLFQLLFDDRRPTPPESLGQRVSVPPPSVAPQPVAAPTAVTAESEHPVPVAPPAFQDASVVPDGPRDFTYRSEKLEWVLAAMCRRAGFTGAVIADNDGLLLAEHNSPVSAAMVAAFTTVLDFSRQKAGRLLGEHGANNMSLDINFTEKVVLRRFAVAGRPYFLIIICGHDLDARSEIELSLEQLSAVLDAGGDVR